MGRAFVGMLAIGCATCGKGEVCDWGPHVITEIKHGPFDVKIPTGWRDGSELKDLAARTVMPAGEHWLAQEKAAFRTAMSSIRFQQQRGVAAVSCAEIEDQMKRENKTSVDVVRIDAAGNPGCKVTFRMPNGANHRAIVTTVGNDLFQVDCVGNDDALDAACNDVFKQLQINYTPAPRVGAQADADKFGSARVKAREKARGCYRRKISSQHQDPAVKVVLAIEIAADGAATVAVRSADNEKAGECAAAALRAAGFPAGIPRSFDETIQW